MKIVIISIDNIDKDAEDNIKKDGPSQDLAIEENLEIKIEGIINPIKMIITKDKEEIMKGKWSSI